RGEQQGRAVGHELLDDLPEVVAAGRVEPGGGLVEEQHRRPVDEGGGQVEPAAHPTGVGLGRAVGGLDQAEALQQLAGPPGDLPAGEVGQAPDEVEVLTAGEVLVARTAWGSRATSMPRTRARPPSGCRIVV